MEHLTIDTLARLVDEPSDPAEAKHLAECEVCASELAALMEQTESLHALPEILPPIATTWPSFTATSPVTRGLRLPSTIVPPRMIRSKLGIVFLPRATRARWTR